MTPEERRIAINASKERVDRDTVMAVPAPDPTKTWNPVPHGDVLRALDETATRMGIAIREESYTLTNQGRNLFGTWTLDMPIGNTSFVQLGFRNSLMKTFAVGICAGTMVIACSNLMFKGEFMEFRKHTSGLNMDVLLEKADSALMQMVTQSHALSDWQEGLRTIELPEPGFKELTYDAMDRGLLAPNRFKAFQEAHKAEVEMSGSRTLYEFHGAATRLMRSVNLFTISTRTQMLQGLCDDYQDRLAA